MSAPDARPAPLRDPAGDPAFDEAWQAQALGIADLLVERGVIDAAEWADALGASLRSKDSTARPDSLDTYYRAVLNALQTLLARSGGAPADEVGRTADTWRRAYLNTPHGQPVELSAGLPVEQP